jgi:signal transduction histidine kinase
VTDGERLAKLRHDLANPLAALLAETQLLLMDGNALAPEVTETLREIERLAIRMRTLLREG